MAEIIGLGLTHYPPLCRPDEEMAFPLRWTLQDPAIPEDVKRPESWPDLMRDEWADDEGRSAAARHRAALLSGLERTRSALDHFDPDVVVIWGDDQYENFREDLIPPFALLAYDDLTVAPWADAQMSSGMKGAANVWGESSDTTFKIRCHRDLAKYLVEGLLDSGVDISYAYEPRHHRGLPHAFLNTVLFLDYDRTGFDHPIVPFSLNCYGRRVVSYRGFLSRFGEAKELDPPSPSPSRFIEVGAATARVLHESPWRVALVASSSWSHAFLCDRTWRLRPDTVADRRFYEALVRGDTTVWRDAPLESIEQAGQQELLNWFALVGAVEELGLELRWSEFVETDVFNSNKVFAIFE